MDYKETYRDLYHGTTEKFASIILSEGFNPSGENNWCGSGVYFYNIKKKAWWAAERKCRELNSKTKEKLKPSIISADIIDIKCQDIFDLRVKADLEDFELFINIILADIPDNGKMKISEVQDEGMRKILLRAMCISFYSQEKGKKLVIGNFRQRPQPLYEHVIEFADSLDMIFGIETIYCVKDPSIITNIRMGGQK